MNQALRAEATVQMIRKADVDSNKKAGRGEWAGITRPGLAECEAGDIESAAGEEDELSGPGQANQWEVPGGPRVWLREGRAELGRTGEDGKGSGHKAEGKDWEMIMALEMTSYSVVYVRN